LCRDSKIKPVGMNQAVYDNVANGRTREAGVSGSHRHLSDDHRGVAQHMCYQQCQVWAVGIMAQEKHDLFIFFPLAGLNGWAPAYFNAPTRASSPAGESKNVT
jgi:hypothetical protein